MVQFRRIRQSALALLLSVGMAGALLGVFAHTPFSAGAHPTQPTAGSGNPYWPPPPSSAGY